MDPEGSIFRRVHAVDVLAVENYVRVGHPFLANPVRSGLVALDLLIPVGKHFEDTVITEEDTSELFQLFGLDRFFRLAVELDFDGFQLRFAQGDSRKKGLDRASRNYV